MVDIKELFKGTMDLVMNKKYIVKVFDKIAEKFDRHEWSISEITTFLLGADVEEIHLFKTAIITDLTLEKVE